MLSLFAGSRESFSQQREKDSNGAGQDFPISANKCLLAGAERDTEVGGVHRGSSGNESELVWIGVIVA